MQVTLSTAPLPGQYWRWRDQLIYYVQAGHKHPDRPPILLIHGFGASTDHWRKNISGLSEDFEVWAIDLLGFGRSAKPNWEYSGDLWRNQLHEFIQEVIGRPAVLSGNSLGGYACLCVAAQRPESAAGLILINSAGPFTDIQGTTKPDPIREVLGSVMQTLFRQDWASFLLFQYVRQKSLIRKTLEKVYLDQSAVTNQLVEEIYRPACDPGADKVFASVFRTPQGEKVDVLLHQLTCPLLMLWGEADPWINARERGEKFRSYHPQLTEYYLQAGHCPHDEVPDQVNGLIREWVMGKKR
ncbi:MAG: alpha/beta fold hydrolase [Scytolyngbya sp. HA4215-MV1]|jgi:pimeloyl-ACP methyl ester carboxylesterase|nr:alpha/beta fold hydrolase [Scytolyngbya sp. HA4215-MV1]